MATARRTARLREAPSVLRNTGRLLARRWPEFLVLALLGMALREAAIWAAVEVSDWNSFVGQLLLILAPLGYLLPVIAMLHRCGPDLPGTSAAMHADAPDAPSEGRDRRLVDIAVSVLIPFVTVYAALGLHDDDFARFANAAAADEIAKLDQADLLARMGFHTLPIVIAIILASWVVRWMLGLTERRTGWYVLAFVGALVEVYYTGQLVAQVTHGWAQVESWFKARAVVVAINDGWHTLLEPLGFLAGPLRAVADALGWLLGNAELLVLVPAAWLVVAAIVLGHKVMPPPAPPRHRVLEKLGPAAKEVGETLFDDAMDRAAVFGQGLRLVFRSGFVNVAVFAAGFLIAARIPYFVSALVRHLLGPTDEWDMLTISLFTEAIGLALSMVVMAPLLAAAVEWLVVPVMADGERRTSSGSGRRTATPR